MAQILINASTGLVRRLASSFNAAYTDLFPAWDVVDRPSESVSELQGLMRAQRPRISLTETADEIYLSPADGTWYVYEPSETDDFDVYWDSGSMGGSFVHRVLVNPPTHIREATREEVEGAGEVFD